MLLRRSVQRLLAAGVALLALSACTSADDPPKATPTPTPPRPVTITFAVYGPGPVIKAYREIAARHSRSHPGTRIDVQAYATHEEAMAARRTSTAAGDPPDLFLMDRDDLVELARDKAIRRVDDLLAAREVDFGDGYTRNGLEAFSAESALQCMPSDISPLVVYYNQSLIDLAQVAEPGRNPVSQERGWSLEEFGRAGLQARGPGVRGVYVAPDLEQVAPFIWSGGGDVVDDVEEPTTLTLSDGPSANALERLLEVVRNPALTFSQQALQRRSAIDRFKAGRLGMILGTRDLTPQFRAEAGLDFDVMPLPRISSGATIATQSGLCISADSEETARAADLLAEVISEDGAATLARTGYVMPANLEVINDEAFLQSGEQPFSAGVFVREVRDTRLLPSSPTWTTVRRAVAAELIELFYQPVILPLEERLEAIDAASVPLFDPSAAPSATPSP